jgi:formylglycine-generating enzyme required for sulfatase activity
MRVLLLLLIMLAGASTPAAEVGLPAEDVAGAQDHPLLPRDENALVIEQTTLDLDRIGLPASPLLPTDRRDGRNNQVFAAADPRNLEGRITRTVYLSPAGRRPLDVRRGYQDAIRALGGESLYLCTSRACGGDISRGPDRANDRTGLVMLLYPWEQRPAPISSLVGCAVRSKHRNQSYLLARLPQSHGAAHVAMLTYAIDAKAVSDDCRALADRAVAIVLVIEPVTGGRPVTPMPDENTAIAPAEAAEGQSTAPTTLQGDTPVAAVSLPPAEAPAAPPKAPRPEPPVVQPRAATEADTAMLEAGEPGSAIRPRDDGGSVQDCPECPVLVRIPAGSFTMGSDDGDSSERPARRVTIAGPVALGKHEVTIAEWRACVAAGGCPALPAMQDEVDSRPMHNLHWLDAMAYITWLRQRTGRPYRLPSEAEWEYAARAGTRSRYWWGERIEGAKVVCQDCGSTLFERLRPPAVDAQPANPFGLRGMSGGVAEWLADCWFHDYVGAPADGRAREAPNCRQRVLRGGSWRDDPAYLGVTTRNFYDADVRYLANGLRVACDLE